MQLIINNDDFGLTYGLNKAVSDSNSAGLTTSVSVLTNGTAYKNAISLIKVKLKSVGVGVHLNLTDGPSPTKELTDNSGNYNNSYFKLIYKSRNKKFLKALETDFEHQIKKLIKDKVHPDHLDSDKHVHMIPAIFEITCRLAKKYKINHVRLSKEKINLSYIIKNMSLTAVKNLSKLVLLSFFSKRNQRILKKYGVYSPDAFYGILHSNEMNIDNFIETLNHALKQNYKTVEILSHPAYTKDKRDIHFISEFMKKYSQLKNREIETETLLDHKLMDFIQTNNIQLTNFRKIS